MFRNPVSSAHQMFFTLIIRKDYYAYKREILRKYLVLQCTTLHTIIIRNERNCRAVVITTLAHADQHHRHDDIVQRWTRAHMFAGQRYSQDDTFNATHVRVKKNIGAVYYVWEGNTHK
jgi:hypothetical protein